MNNDLIDLKDQRFGIWLVIEQAPRWDNKTRWICECQVCGARRSKSSVGLRKSTYQSCDGKHKEGATSGPYPIRKPSGYAAGTERFHNYRVAAGKRGLMF